ncbi:MAG: hypothetical protein H0V80_04140 [Acidobacteria bacterium]|nr:hypothetical protein [Acidobacteriota bacterium]
MPRSQVTTSAVLATLAPTPPAWVDTLVGAAPQLDRIVTDGLSVEVRTGAHFTHLAVHVPDADALAPEALHARVRDAYLAVAGTLNQQQRHPLRFWNFVPRIHTPAGPGVDRYMVFNGGRFAACEHWHGSPNDFDHTLASASGVGILGSSLAVHCLAADVAGEPVENPRQVPAYRYSQRYGPRPPCFARATRLLSPVDGAWWLLVAGTASICGEETMHAGDIEAQTIETFANLDALLSTAHSRRTGGLVGVAAPRFTSVRVYIVRPDHLAVVRDLVQGRYGEVPEIEYAQAELCRTDLLVEIEGVAEL